MHKEWPIAGLDGGDDYGVGYFPQTIFPGDFQLTSNRKGQCLSLYKVETNEQWANAPL